MKKVSMSIVNEMMNAIVSMPRWREIQDTDPIIQEAEVRMGKALEVIESVIPDEQVEEIREAAYGLVTALEFPAILYGIHLANSFAAAVINPPDLSHYILKRQ